MISKSNLIKLMLVLLLSPELSFPKNRNFSCLNFVNANSDNIYILVNMTIKPLETHSKMLEVEERLSKFAYLSKDCLPGAADAFIYQTLRICHRKKYFNSGLPSKQKYVNFYHWYIMMGQFSPSVV